MSEYQYYEFQAIDRPLSRREMDALEACSSRATITPSRFVNHYEWGDFKGDPQKWMEKYFDAHLYLANWGSRHLSLRFPRTVLPLETAKAYCRSDSASVSAKGDHVILNLASEDEEGDWDSDGREEMASILPVRAAIAAGDHRALYLGWLLSVQAEEVEDDEREPPCPPGLGELTGPLEALVAFLRVDRDLLVVAAERSPQAEATPPEAAIAKWISGLPESERTSLLVRVAAGEETQLRGELLRRFREATRPRGDEAGTGPRTAGDLREAAQSRATERRRKEAERRERERVEEDRRAAEARRKHLAGLARREPEAWREVDTLVSTSKPKCYDQAVVLLKDLRDLNAGRGTEAGFRSRMLALLDRYSKRSSFLQRLEKADLA